MSKIFRKDETLKVLENSGTKRLTLPSGWEQLTGMEVGEEIVGAVILGKHGFFVGYWKKFNQPGVQELEDLEELEEEIMQNGSDD